MHSKRILFLTSIFSIFFFQLIAQPQDNSPYSRFGLGDIHNDNFIFNQGMGNLGASSLDPWHINLVNPASYAYLQATAFEVGLDASYKRLSSSTEQANIYKGNVNYFALGLPLINPINDALERIQRSYDLGLVFALKPHSTVGYNVVSTEDHPDEGSIERNYVGDGGTYKFLTGFAGRYKNFSLGANVGYLFGKISYNSLVYFADLPFAYHNDFNESFNVSGFLYKLGASYTATLNKSKLSPENNIEPNKLTIGVYGNTSTSFNSNGEVLYSAVLTSLNLGTLNYDTLVPLQQIEGKGTLPAQIGAGISYRHGQKLMVGVNYEQNFWSQYSNEGKLADDHLMDAYNFSMGVDWVPDHLSYTNPFKRMHYRAGFYYKTDGRSENGEQFKETAVNLGFGMPFVFKRKTSHIDLSLSIGQSLGNRLISENFVKFGVGLTFNDQEWFIKRRYY